MTGAWKLHFVEEPYNCIPPKCFCCNLIPCCISIVSLPMWMKDSLSMRTLLLFFGRFFFFFHMWMSEHLGDTWNWLVSRALLRSRLWLVSLRLLSSPSRRIRSSWTALSSPLSTEPWASSSACNANHSFCWAWSLQQHRGLQSPLPRSCGVL